ncbi:MAG: alpha/beta hydrolase [Alphaproteobacteria bacterium]|jgi:pimeloyl-ACP methyl ester carboxylesterase|nr:alpha/beta hydrolase [Rhodospirillaceae bacterium]MDG2479545.1 alpha/beta hydrolase [Alphaproteobacteria bacterium]MBT6203436.1 alpha/beta hydrolase [Rhodospirillaceae bacterium]MBT6510023.1 alpha/beta hydrolase [Rhodospirillaceae bacterium]MBT7615459.1 alpha/beta hydrolase [Rhodospirillaceae bacterium]
MSTRRSFVLVHGAWHGGWCWRDVATLLCGHGHYVTTPTMTGLGERSHLLGPDITIDTHVDDIVNHLVWNDLANVVLVGHSYGGGIVLGVADRVPERLARLILLDAGFLRNGETCMDELAPEVAADRLRLARETSGGLTLPVPPASAFGGVTADQGTWLDGLLTPHPLRTYTTPLRLDHPPGNGLPADYIACTDPAYAVMDPIWDRVRAAGWPFHELATGHDAMVIAPEETAALLEQVSGG